RSHNRANRYCLPPIPLMLSVICRHPCLCRACYSIFPGSHSFEAANSSSICPEPKGDPPPDPSTPTHNHRVSVSMHFPGAHIISVNQFERADVERIFDVADSMVPYAHRERMTKVLEGAILGNLFFEASTRTRLSFGCAFNLLGGDVRETTDVKTSSISKGESLYDTARVISGYNDIIVMRHPQPGSVSEFARASRVPVINAGDGPNEHPSQALLDLYTIRKELGSQGKQIEGMKIAMIGDLKHGRTVHSLSQLIQLYPYVTFTLISPAELRMPPEIVEELRNNGHTVIETEDLEQGLVGNDTDRK